VKNLPQDINIREKKASPNRKRLIHKNIGCPNFTLKCKARKNTAVKKKPTIPQTMEKPCIKHNNKQTTATKRPAAAILSTTE
jgi:hypothetical protein